MTLDEAIRHCLKQARKLQDKADRVGGDESRQCMECAADHIQLAEWLKELKEARRLLKLAMQDLAADDCTFCKYGADDIAICQSKPANCFVWRHEDDALKQLTKG